MTESASPVTTLDPPPTPSDAAARDPVSESSRGPESRREPPWEWFWQSNRARALRLEREKISMRAQAYIDRAQASFDAAESLGPNQNPNADASSAGPILELLRQAATWASLAILDQIEKEAEPPLTESSWREVSLRLGLAQAQELWKSWLSQPQTAHVDEQFRQARVAELTAITSKLLLTAKSVTIELDAILSRRIYHLGVPLLLVLAAAAMFLSAPN